MARPREFDADEVMKGAMNVFWRDGYDGASMPALLKGMKLTRGSLYKAFTDKKSLFLRAVERYEMDAVTPAVRLLTNPDIADGAVRIETMFQNVVNVVRTGDRRGCLLCNAAAGPASYDEEIADLVQSVLTRMREGFAAALNASPRHAALDDAARAEIAALLVTQYTGLRILARSHAPIAELDASAAAVGTFLRR